MLERAKELEAIASPEVQEPFAYGSVIEFNREKGHGIVREAGGLSVAIDMEQSAAFENGSMRPWREREVRVKPLRGDNVLCRLSDNVDDGHTIAEEWAVVPDFRRR